MDGAGVSEMYARWRGTYWHFGKKAATIIAPPEAPSSLPLKSASVMSVFIVTAFLSPKVIVSNALMAENISGVGQRIFSYLPALGEKGSQHNCV